MKQLLVVALLLWLLMSATRYNVYILFVMFHVRLNKLSCWTKEKHVDQLLIRFVCVLTCICIWKFDSIKFYWFLNDMALTPDANMPLFFCCCSLLYWVTNLLYVYNNRATFQLVCMCELFDVMISANATPFMNTK